MTSVRLVFVFVSMMFAFGCEPDPDTPTKRWEHVFSDLPGALLGVWGSGAGDVFVVGADVGAGPWVLHWDGTRWRRLNTGATGTLWWVSGTGPSARVWMAGQAGLVLRHERNSGAFVRVEGVPANVTIFGIFEVDGEVWAVGGEDSGSVGHAYRLVGDVFVADDGIASEVKDAGHFFKVWGRAGDDLWIVGLGGKMLHRDAAGWRAIDTPSGRRLFTIHGNANLALAVGGFATGLVVEAAGTTVRDVTPPGAKQLNGVWVERDGTVIAVGVEGTVMERRGSVWRAPSGLPATLDDYHAVYVDPEGGVWAVGGFLVVEPQKNGMLLHYGEPIADTF
jgi:hypothetical protein